MNDIKQTYTLSGHDKSISHSRPHSHLMQEIKTSTYSDTFVYIVDMVWKVFIECTLQSFGLTTDNH